MHREIYEKVLEAIMISLNGDVFERQMAENGLMEKDIDEAWHKMCDLAETLE